MVSMASSYTDMSKQRAQANVGIIDTFPLYSASEAFMNHDIENVEYIQAGEAHSAREQL